MERKNPRMEEQSNASTSAPPPPSPPWTELPPDITANILLRLGVVDLLESAQMVCTTWHSVCKDPAMWRKIDMSGEDDHGDAEIICKHAVDRSQGQLVDIKIGGFGTQYLLEYIAERSSQLQSLFLASCNEITDHGLGEVIKRFPLLEELHLFRADFYYGTIHIVGRSCPLLKSFSFGADPLSINRHVRAPTGDYEVSAIVEAMPGLRHLGLVGNTLTNDGLLDILEGCSHLESLDIRRCFGVNLDEDILKQYSQQLKSLKRPNDSIADLDMYSSDAFENEFDDYGTYISNFDWDTHIDLLIEQEYLMDGGDIF